MSNKNQKIELLDQYKNAVASFKAGQFARAHQLIREYRWGVDYNTFSKFDNRDEDPGCVSVIILSRDWCNTLIECLNSLKNQNGPAFEIIVINNGGKKRFDNVQIDIPMLIVECPIAFTPSEGRNIGAFFSRADILIFLDDDALAENNFVESVVRAFREYHFIGIRGKIIPKSADTVDSLAGLYDLGDYPIPALLDTEGNMAIRKKCYDEVNGMNPLLYGGEGLDLTSRLLDAHPNGDVYYWPKMIIRHDYASGKNLLEKRKRQALSKQYFGIMYPDNLKIKDRYNLIYRACRKEKDRNATKNFAHKVIKHGKEFFLALRSEKAQQVDEESIQPQTFNADRTVHISEQQFSETEICALLRRVEILEKELEITRKSLTYKFGSIIGESARSPLREAPLLPFRLARLIIDFYKRRNQKTQIHSKVLGKTIRNRMQYTRFGREDHVFNLFKKFRPFRKTRNSNLRIACILSSWMFDCLDFEADLIPLDIDNWNNAIDRKKPDFLLVQGCIEKTNLWQKYLFKSDGPSDELIEVLDYCKAHGIPTVFWDVEDHVHVPLFIKTAVLFDHIFVADPQSIDKYQKKLSQQVKLLGPAVQPALHNPIKHANDNYHGFTYLYDGWADLTEYSDSSDYLKPLLKHGLHIVDSRFQMRANKLDDLSSFRENIMGCLSYKQLLSALRHYKVLIMSNKTLSAPLQRSWRALEAMACGCDVLLCGKRMVSMPNEIQLILADKKNLKNEALKTLENEIDFLKTMQIKRRKIYTSHTYAQRIGTICKTIGIEHGWEQYPLVSVVIPTKRPELVNACIANFNKQIYPRKELIIIINSSEKELDYTSSLMSDHLNVNIIQLHQEKNIGTCLNYGIAHAKGKYWFKMDDDDIYGKNYLIDMVQLAECADFNIMGKPFAFVYMENDGKIYLHNSAIDCQHTIGSIYMPSLCGATLGGKIDTFSGFSEQHRACVDVGFAEDQKAQRQKIISGDIWNFIAFRNKDKTMHTWRLKDDDIKMNASYFENNDKKQTIMI